MFVSQLSLSHTEICVFRFLRYLEGQEREGQKWFPEGRIVLGFSLPASKHPNIKAEEPG